MTTRRTLLLLVALFAATLTAPAQSVTGMMPLDPYLATGPEVRFAIDFDAPVSGVDPTDFAVATVRSGAAVLPMLDVNVDVHVHVHEHEHEHEHGIGDGNGDGNGDGSRDGSRDGGSGGRAARKRRARERGAPGLDKGWRRLRGEGGARPDTGVNGGAVVADSAPGEGAGLAFARRRS